MSSKFIVYAIKHRGMKIPLFLSAFTQSNVKIGKVRILIADQVSIIDPFYHGRMFIVEREEMSN